jgi:hypothetical protein
LHNLIIRIEKDTGIHDDNTWPGEGNVNMDEDREDDRDMGDEDREDDEDMGNEEPTDGTLFQQKVMADLFERLNL